MNEYRVARFYEARYYCQIVKEKTPKAPSPFGVEVVRNAQKFPFHSRQGGLRNVVNFTNRGHQT